MGEPDVDYRCLEDMLPETVARLQLPAHLIYTDGSKSVDGVGAAYSYWRDGTEIRTKRMRLESMCTVFQAELLAIARATDLVVRGGFGCAAVLSDSLWFPHCWWHLVSEQLQQWCWCRSCRSACARSVAPHVRWLRRVGFCRWAAPAPASPLLAAAARFYHVFALAATSTYVLQQLIYAYQASGYNNITD
ncbi:hypothetical protein HW555_012255 [Spodoptera exigua]|uniref:RNase H type-1 domain-containing protein n=1 Tax=Spodoptera exigua TaxID=7107 RepID=A0A835KY37_SPOEX|nr:hypothetical protein HW555_012255 [Spodoptera exigua]